MSPGEASAYHEGRLAAVREQRDGGYVCPYRSGPRRAAWHRGLAAGRTECANLEHNRRVEAVPETEREANKAGMRSAIEEWLAKQSEAPAPKQASKLFTEVRLEPINFAAIAAEAGCTRGKLLHSPHLGWGVRPHDRQPADFCAITPPTLRDGETELRISADERHWVFMGWVTPEPNTQVSHD